MPCYFRSVTIKCICNSSLCARSLRGEGEGQGQGQGRREGSEFEYLL